MRRDVHARIRLNRVLKEFEEDSQKQKREALALLRRLDWRSRPSWLQPVRRHWRPQ